MVRLIHIGDCLEVMKGLESASIDAIVTDPPYGLSAGPVGYIGEKTGGGFMGKDWDSGVPGVAFWAEALRVAKPGCHILAAGGSRTYHRLAVAIEDAGWEIRDCVMWIYGSGFPKSHDVSKAIDKAAGAEREVIKATGQRCGVFAHSGTGKPQNILDYNAKVTAPATDAAKQWHGWGTALKPAFEPFILARKPLDGTVANNVLKHGCGGLNVDGCRVGTDDTRAPSYRMTSKGRPGGGFGNDMDYSRSGLVAGSASGRWPANVIHDGSEAVVAGFPEVKSGGGNKRSKDSGMWSGKKPMDSHWESNGGSAARFFYVPKASRFEREAGLDETPNHHPTVKPVALMQYLCRLITPPNATILDPFCGSGSTGVAAVREGFNFIGIELNPEYAEIAKRRIAHEQEKTALLK